MNNNIFIPYGGVTISEAAVWKWYLNVAKELSFSFLSKDDKSYFSDYYCEAGLLRTWRQPFFRHHFVRSFTKALHFIFQTPFPPRILDLGCGTGTQSLMFALLGADVVGIDIDTNALSILDKRKAFYEDMTGGKKLSLKIYTANSLDFDYEHIAPLNAVYSMFAFNMMKPASELLKKIIPHAAAGCRFVVIDGNSTSWLPKLLPTRRRTASLTPIEFEQCLASHSFKTVAHEQGFVIPPVFWNICPYHVLKKIDNFLGKHWLLAISHQIMAEKV